MTESPTVYRVIDSVLSSRERADRVLSLCVEGDVSAARRLLVRAPDPDALLAEGAVEYWLANTTANGSFEAAKDLLSNASRAFEENGDNDRARLTDIWLSLCYWRQGQAVEALVLTSRGTEASDPRVRFFAFMNQSVLHSENRHWRDCLRSLDHAQRFFDSEPSLSWRGKFFQQRGLAYKQAFEEIGSSDYLDKALIEYEAANDYYERAGNIRFEAAILNNLANLYRSANQLARAHSNANRAITLYERIGDRSHLGHAKDTKALILLDEGKYALARRYADQSIALLRNHDPAWVTIPLVTRARILCKIGLHSAAQNDFEDAVHLAESAGDNVKAVEIYIEQANALTDYLSIHALRRIVLRINELQPSKLTGVLVKVLSRADAPEGFSLKELKSAELQHEKELILRALESSQGSVTRAASKLGKTHGGLAHIIKTRHPDLVKYCRPVVPRRKSQK